jgi:hypothetical protein
MHIHTVGLDIQLPADRLVDIFLLQLHSPVQADGLAPYPPEQSAARGEFLNRFAQWLRQTYQPANANRPFFVLAPELSIPLQHVPILEGMVRELRRACEEAANGRQLDFTFVLERNEDQTAAHFKRSVAAYFEPPDGMADTSAGCLVFVNNANPTFGKSTQWGKSMFLFPFTRRWRVSGSPTYWVSDEGPHNHQAVVVREPGPSIYWLRYKPQYLVNSTPGSGQPGPFVDNQALAVWINGQAFPAPVDFQAIQPVIHWLISEWSCIEPAFIKELREVGRPDVVRNALHAAYNESVERWRETLGTNEILAKRVVNLCFSGFPGAVFGKETMEPQLWPADVSSGVRRFLELYSVLHSALPVASNLRPAATNSAHALIRHNAGPTELITWIQQSLRGPLGGELETSIAAGLAFCLTEEMPRESQVQRVDRLPLARARLEARARGNAPAGEMIRHIIEAWVLAQHAYWAVSRGLADARAGGRMLIRLRVILDEGGWRLTPGAVIGGPPRPTPDRLQTAISLASECGLL